MNLTRVRTLKQGVNNNGPVIYWMSRDQRAQNNWALLYAQEQALSLKVPLTVIFCLSASFLGATAVQYRFMLENLRTVSTDLEAKNIKFHILVGEPSTVLANYISQEKSAMLITDFDPLLCKRQWKRSVIERVSVSVFEVDAHNVIPCWVASHRQEYGAYTLRPKIHRLLPTYLDPYPILLKHPFTNPASCTEILWDTLLKEYGGSTDPLPPFAPSSGEASAQAKLSEFITLGLGRYDDLRNDPSLCGQSGLSPYLHFGQISAQHAALSILKSGELKTHQDVFLEELIIRRELADNFCYYNENYDNVKGFPAWAQETLSNHLHDERPYLYNRSILENAQTHDPAWNAAQQQMVLTGSMHGYMRMYWAKKILEWSSSPDAAMQTALYLNDRYELDGRDPNGYAGIAWSMGGVHDRAWSERAVFGKIRYMNYAGLRRKFAVENYINKIALLNAVLEQS